LLPDNSLITDIKVQITDALHAYIPLQPAVKSSQAQSMSVQIYYIFMRNIELK
jgi:hypothetical protein